MKPISLLFATLAITASQSESVLSSELIAPAHISHRAHQSDGRHYSHQKHITNDVLVPVNLEPIVPAVWQYKSRDIDFRRDPVWT